MKIENFYDETQEEQISVDGQMYTFKNVRVDDNWGISWQDIYGVWHTEPESFIRDGFIEITIAMLGETEGRQLLAVTNAEILIKYIRKHIQRNAN